MSDRAPLPAIKDIAPALKSAELRPRHFAIRRRAPKCFSLPPTMSARLCEQKHSKFKKRKRTSRSNLPARTIFFCGASNLSLHTAANISAKFYSRLFREVTGHTLEGPQVVARLV